jgi:hypothetical protein
MNAQSNILPAPVKAESKFFWTTFLLALFLGIFGAHRFYNKSPKSILMLVTLGGFGIWTLIDVLTIIFGKFKDAEGRYIENPKPAAAWTVLVLFAIIFGSGGSGSGGLGSRDMNQYKSEDGNTVITITLKSSHANIIMRGMSGPIPLRWTVGSGGIGLTQSDGTLFAVLSAKSGTEMKDGYPVTMVDTDGTVYHLVK